MVIKQKGDLVCVGLRWFVCCLSQVNKVVDEKVSITIIRLLLHYLQESLLLSHCPLLNQSGSYGTILHSRGLNAVVSLGLYALLEDKNGVCY